MIKHILGSILVLSIVFSYQVFGFEVPLHDQYVTDLAGVLSDGDEEDLEVSMYKIRQNTDIEGAILIVPSLSGETIESVSLQVAESWGVGDAEKDNGFIVLVAITDRKVRIEVGYGLEYILTDGRTKSIIDQNIPPYFRAGDYAGGLQAVLTDIGKTLSGDVEIDAFEGNTVDDYVYDGESDSAYAILIIFGFIFFVVGLGLMLEFVVTDPKYSAKHKERAKNAGKSKPYIDVKGWKNFAIIFVIFTVALCIFSALIIGSIISTVIALFLALWISLQESYGGGSSGSSGSSSSWSPTRSSRSSSSSSSSSSWSSGSSFGGFSGGSFGGGGSSGSR